MARGSIEAIFVAPDSGEPMEVVESVEAVAGRGLRGDRYFREQGLYDCREELPEGTDVSLIEREALDAIERDHEVDLPARLTRRNVVTSDVALNHLVDRTFRIGDVELVGERLCEPCSYMESLAETEGASEALTHRGGLNANVIELGTIAIGDTVEF
ncbi:MOSC domain protein [Halorubrum sp. DM2]|uniref:MOSC domain-containing protein n=1 Tax=Halorubrum sp. DM2 TaxID=2527867 RepID=UPI0024B8652C|nr:MOSC domain-containing protein [Halorubrum sp. DM2]VTT86223.1 MOSC domain protein [Halorubrum sp. DM2]